MDRNLLWLAVLAGTYVVAMRMGREQGLAEGLAQFQAPAGAPGNAPVFDIGEISENFPFPTEPLF